MSFIMACTFVCIKVRVTGARVIRGMLVEAEGFSIIEMDIMNVFCCEVNGMSDMM